LSLPTRSGVSNEGREFFLVFSDIGGATDNKLYITTSSQNEVHVSIDAPAFSTYPASFTLTPNEPWPSGTPWSASNSAICLEGTEKSNKGVHVKATDDVTVYVMNLKGKASAGYLAFPKEGDYI